MQEFIEYLEHIEKRDNLPSWIISTAKNHLESEKKQILKAWIHGAVRSPLELKHINNPQGYYDSTFGDNHEAGI